MKSNTTSHISRIKKHIKELLPDMRSGNLSPVIKEMKRNGVDIDEFSQTLRNIIRYRLLIELNSDEPPTRSFICRYALNLLTNELIFMPKDDIEAKIYFKLSFALRITGKKNHNRNKNKIITNDSKNYYTI